MTEERTGEKQGENPTTPEKKERVAVCLVCSNEWIARTGAAKKPAKCPVCGTKRCAWKDDMPTEPEKQPVELEKTAHISERTEGNEGEEKEKAGEIEEKIKERREGKREKNTGFILPDGSGVAFGTIGSDEPETNKEKTPEEKPTPGGFPIMLVVAGLVVLGTLAGVGWFLGRYRSMGPGTPAQVYQPPTAAERAMMRMGVA